MSDDNAYREFREAYSDVLADRHLDLPGRARQTRSAVRRGATLTQTTLVMPFAVLGAHDDAAVARVYSEKKPGK